MKTTINQKKFRNYFENKVKSLSDEQIKELFDGSFFFESIVLPLIAHNCKLSRHVDNFITTYIELSSIITDAMIKVNGRRLRESKYENEECN